MQGYVAITDPGWYEQLSRRPQPCDANFWRPSTRRVGLAAGAPFFFKLKAPLRKIAGYGFFRSFTTLPDWLAWETFDTANGVRDLDALRARLGKIRRGARIEENPRGEIGCCLLAEARFFPREAWVDPPADLSPRTQSGKGYDLRSGEGLRIWRECQERTMVAADAPITEPPRPSGARFGRPQLRQPRLGQGLFRIEVLNAYERACAVTGEHSLPVLDAAHIRPYHRGGEHDVRNGLSLRTDLHRLFDRGYVTFDEDRRLVVSDRLSRDYNNGRIYYERQGAPLRVPASTTLAPSDEALRWHRDEVFLG